MEECDARIVANPTYNRRERKFRIVKTIIILISSIFILVRGRERFKKFII